MQVICENCTTTYKIDESKIPPKGGTTNCARCDSKIHIESPNIEKAAERITAPDRENRDKIADKKPGKGKPASKLMSFLKQYLKREETDQIIEDLKSIKFKEEIIPIDENNVSILKKDFVFWSVVMLGTTPLFISSIDIRSFQLSTFAIFFAVIWGVIFKKFVVEDAGHWKLPLFAALFTGIIGLNGLGIVYTFLPSLETSDNKIISLFGYIFFVGILEELCKIIPVLFYLFWRKKKADALTIIIIGIFSGLGFAAFENTSYYSVAVVKAYLKTAYLGVGGLVDGVQGAMVLAMLRSISLVFCHATWSGIFAYFIALGHVTQKRRIALFIVGLSASALIHGVYDWFCGIQTLLAALIAGFSFILFYAYKTKLRLLLSDIKKIRIRAWKSQIPN